MEGQDMKAYQLLSNPDSLLTDGRNAANSCGATVKWWSDDATKFSILAALSKCYWTNSDTPAEVVGLCLNKIRERVGDFAGVWASSVTHDNMIKTLKELGI